MNTCSFEEVTHTRINEVLPCVEHKNGGLRFIFCGFIGLFGNFQPHEMIIRVCFRLNQKGGSVFIFTQTQPQNIVALHQMISEFLWYDFNIFK